jgi:phage terminase Nu1 subunit (DNA packaging protein)
MDLSRVSINQLANYTGKDRRTIRRRLSNLQRGPDNRYASPEAMRAIYTADKPTDLEHQQARLAAARANVAEIQGADLRNELVPAAEARHYWTQIVANADRRLRLLPAACARAIRGERDLPVLELKLREQVEAALVDLADFMPRP